MPTAVASLIPMSLPTVSYTSRFLHKTSFPHSQIMKSAALTYLTVIISCISPSIKAEDESISIINGVIFKKVKVQARIYTASLPLFYREDISLRDNFVEKYINYTYNTHEPPKCQHLNFTHTDCLIAHASFENCAKKK